MKKGRKNLRIIYFGKVMEKYKMKRRRKKKKEEKRKKEEIMDDLKFNSTFISNLCVHCIPSQLMDLFQFPNQACQSKVS